MTLKKQHGASAVEFAILLPFLVMLVFGIIEFGLLLYNQQVLTNASREGARAAIVGDCTSRLDDSTTSGIGKIVRDYCANRLITFKITNDPPDIMVSPDENDRACGTPLINMGANLTVRVEYDYEFLLPGLLGFGTSKTLSAQTVMKMESDET